MQIAARWVGGCSPMVGAIAVVASLVASSSAPKPSETWREFSWKSYASCPTGSQGEQQSRFAIESCLAEHADWIAILPDDSPSWDGAGVIVHEHTALDRCLVRKRRTGAFMCRIVVSRDGMQLQGELEARSNWRRRPADVFFHQPKSIGVDHY